MHIFILSLCLLVCMSICQIFCPSVPMSLPGQHSSHYNIIIYLSPPPTQPPLVIYYLLFFGRLKFWGPWLLGSYIGLRKVCALHWWVIEELPLLVSTKAQLGLSMPLFSPIFCFCCLPQLETSKMALDFSDMCAKFVHSGQGQACTNMGSKDPLRHEQKSP